MNEHSLLRSASVTALLIAMSACGGGGGSSAEPPAALPASLALAVPAQAELGATVALSSDLGEGRPGLSFSWDFGDGSSAAQARPSHAYVQPGRYTLTLTVSNAAGQRVSAQAAMQVGRFAMVNDRQCSGANGSGWCWQSPLPDGLRVDDVFFLDAQRGWAVGERGRVWSSSDGGEHWQRLPDLSGYSLTQVVFSDADNGWALTDVRARLARSRDGGRSWEMVTTPDADDAAFRGYSRLLVLNRETVVAVGSGLLPNSASGAWPMTSITTDGGTHWRHPALVPDLALPDGSLWQTGYLQNPGSRACKSTDLGVTSAPFADLPWNASLTVNSSMDIWAIGTDYTEPGAKQYIYRSRDGGLSFERWAYTPLSGVTGLPEFSARQDSAWVIDQGSKAVLRSEDGARTWIRVTIPGLSGQASQQVDVNTLKPDGLFARVDRQLQLTEDGGRSWRMLANPDDSSTFYLLRREPAGALRLWGRTAQFRSPDGGQQWWPTPGSLREDLGSLEFTGLAFADQRRGLALDVRGIWFDTADGGRQWQRRAGTPVSCSGPTSSLQLTGGGRGWALVNGCLLSTDDGGQTWAQAPRPEAMQSLVALRFHSTLRGWAVASSGQGFSTKDGGLTWQASDAAPQAVQAVSAADGSSLWRIDPRDLSSLARSSDGGANWVSVSVPAGSLLRGLWFVDARTGWLVGDGGLVLATTDGGQTWQRQDSGSSSTLYTVHALDSATAWAAGRRSTVLATATGGR